MDRDVRSLGCHRSARPASIPPGAEPGTGGWHSLSAMVVRKVKAILVTLRLQGWKPHGLKFFYVLSLSPDLLWCVHVHIPGETLRKIDYINKNKTKQNTEAQCKTMIALVLNDKIQIYVKFLTGQSHGSCVRIKVLI